MSNEEKEKLYACIDTICTMQNMLKPHIGANTFMEKYLMDVYNTGAVFLSSIPVTFTEYLKHRGKL